MYRYLFHQAIWTKPGHTSQAESVLRLLVKEGCHLTMEGVEQRSAWVVVE